MSHSRVKVYGEVLIPYPGRHCGVQDCPVDLPSQSAYVASLTALVMLFTSHEKGSHTRSFAPSKSPLASHTRVKVDGGAVIW